MLGITSRNLSIGLTLFFFGLAKKVLIADNLSTTVARVFDAPAAEHPGFHDAWLAALTYAMQIYFDFSGYTDMAIGLARLFGVRLPVNFNSPYKANSIIDFWRRWHITLSRFLRDYLYIPLGGNRRGKLMRYVNLMITMLLGGLWHGANWTFLVWGGLHALYLCANHAYIAVKPESVNDVPPARWSVAWKRSLTFVCVVIAWVVFRASSLPAAGHLLAAMSGFHGVHLHDIARSHMRWPAVLALIAFCFTAPNTQHLMALVRPALGVLPPPPDQRSGRLLWRPTAAWAVVTAVLAVVGIISLSSVSEFIYYQF